MWSLAMVLGVGTCMSRPSMGELSNLCRLLSVPQRQNVQIDENIGAGKPSAARIKPFSARFISMSRQTLKAEVRLQAATSGVCLVAGRLQIINRGWLRQQSARDGLFASAYPPG